jgi:hypothetical protein
MSCKIIRIAHRLLPHEVLDDVLDKELKAMRIAGNEECMLKAFLGV